MKIILFQEKIWSGSLECEIFFRLWLAEATIQVRETFCHHLGESIFDRFLRHALVIYFINIIIILAF